MDTTRKRLSAEQLAILQDVYLDMVQRRDPKAAVAVIDKFQSSMSEQARRDSMLIRKAEVLMFQLGDVESATRGLAKFMEEEGELADWARIRLGDIAFLKGDLNKATEFYSKAQSAARMRRNKIGGLVTEDIIGQTPEAPSTGTKKGERAGKPRPLGTPREKEPLGHIADSPANEVLPLGGAGGAGGSGWRIGALRDVSNSENVKQLIDEGYLLEAREALRAWEREFPLSKISGDLLLMDAHYHMAVGDWKRARAMLEAYCKLVDASSFLPEALRKLMVCVDELKVPRSEVRELFEKSRKRLQYHPVAEEIEEFLAAGK
jgi:tetratricopeptide (TPR) repeat protein